MPSKLLGLLKKGVKYSRPYVNNYLKNLGMGRRRRSSRRGGSRSCGTPNPGRHGYRRGGGKTWDKFKGWIKKGHQYIRDNDLASSAVGLVPHPKAQAVAAALKAIGYGKRRRGGSYCQKGIPKGRGSSRRMGKGSLQRWHDPITGMTMTADRPGPHDVGGLRNFRFD